MTPLDLANESTATPASPAPQKIRGAHAWIWIVLLYVAVIGAFGVMVTIAIRNSPQFIPVGESKPAAASHGRH